MGIIVGRIISIVMVVLLMMVAFSADAELRVAATGDSHTARYADTSIGHGTLAELVYKQRRNDVSMFPIYTGGVSAIDYVNQGSVADVLVQDPDVIQLLLGTNDAAQRWGLPTYSFYMTTIIDAFVGYTNGRSHHPLLVIATAPPIIAPDPNANLATLHIEANNTWLRNEAQVRDDFVLIDYHAALTSIDGWENYYSDGVHLDSAMTPYLTYGQYSAGYILLAEMFRDAALAELPEPSSLAVIAALICPGLFVRRHPQ